MATSTLLAVPNVSEGRSEVSICAIAEAFVPGGASAPAAEGRVRLLDVHRDADHHRSVFTLAGPGKALADALLSGAREALERVDVMHRRAGEDEDENGQHPYVGAIDVAPVVYLEPGARGAACAVALVVADRLGEELGVPVFLYGELTEEGEGRARSRADLRRGGVGVLAQRMAPAPREPGRRRAPRLAPDFGPAAMHPTGGATLVSARPPLVAFNLQLAPPASIADARRIAALIREGGAQGLPGVRAIAVLLDGGVPQVSMNVERPFELALAELVRAVGAHAELAGGELVGLAPGAAFEGFPEDLAMPGFDPARHLIENAIGWG